MKQERNIIKIDRELCTGCGQCVLDCAEGAIAIVDGKATVIADSYCDGLGACLQGCPESALTIEIREADPFDEEAAMAHVARLKAEKQTQAGADSGLMQPAVSRGCPSAAPVILPMASTREKPIAGTRLPIWPVKLRLLSPGVTFPPGIRLVFAADCAPASSNRFHDICAGAALIIACPKFEERQETMARLSALLRGARPASVTVVRMEVPCCRPLAALCLQICADAGIRAEEYVMTRDGRLEKQPANTLTPLRFA